MKGTAVMGTAETGTAEKETAVKEILCPYTPLVFAQLGTAGRKSEIAGRTANGTIYPWNSDRFPLGSERATFGTVAPPAVVSVAVETFAGVGNWTGS